MFDPSKILAWLESNVEGMRRSRMKTLADIVDAALLMHGVGVLALGRAMAGETAAKHCIKPRLAPSAQRISRWRRSRRRC